MDLTLKTLVSSLASSLLSHSEQFEPYIPNSKQNLYYSLNLLSELGELTHISLPSTTPETLFVPVKKSVASENLSESQPPNLGPKIPPPSTASATTASSRQSATSQGHGSKQPLGGVAKERSRETDQSLLQALQTLRESKQFQRKTMGVFSPILRGNT